VGKTGLVPGGVPGLGVPVRIVWVEVGVKRVGKASGVTVEEGGGGVGVGVRIGEGVRGFCLHSSMLYVQQYFV
jgi:hypothetical protein